MAEKEYIEREALWRAFEYEPFYDNADRDEIVLPKIDAFPAADVAPVVHGRWLPQILLGRRVWDCSECKTLGTPHWKRCPVCEAKMDLEGGNT